MTAPELQAFRQSMGWSVAHLADQLGSPISTVRGWLYGRRSIPPTVAKLCELHLGQWERDKSRDIFPAS